jgi:hypothetical protein
MASNGGKDATMNSPDELPVGILEERAAEQRRRLHDSVGELKTTVREEVRERLDLSHYGREYFWPASITVSLMGMALGYSIAGMFTRH